MSIVIRIIRDCFPYNDVTSGPSYAVYQKIESVTLNTTEDLWEFLSQGSLSREYCDFDNGAIVLRFRTSAKEDTVAEARRRIDDGWKILAEGLQHYDFPRHGLSEVAAALDELKLEELKKANAEYLRKLLEAQELQKKLTREGKVSKTRW